MSSIKWKNKKITSFYLPDYLQSKEVPSIFYSSATDFSDRTLKFSIQQLGVKLLKDSIVKFKIAANSDRVLEAVGFQHNAWEKDLKIIRCIHDLNYGEDTLRIEFKVFHKDKISITYCKEIRKNVLTCLKNLNFKSGAEFFKYLIYNSVLMEKNIGRELKKVSEEVKICKIIKVKFVI